MTFTTHTSFLDLISKYDGFILDQFGVMHNGSNALPGAVDVVQRLHKEGKKLVILSNTSSPSSSALNKLPKLGFDPKCFMGAITSGEEAAKYIVNKFVGKKALLISWKDNPATDVFLGLCGNPMLVDDPNDADYIIAHGMQAVWGCSSQGNGKNVRVVTDLSASLWEKGDFSELDPILKTCAERRLPMVNANPDFTCVVADGSHKPMPGKIASRYEGFGGKCTYFGKPHAEHFEACVRQIGLPKDRIVHVGDSLHHDIAGANETGISCIFVSSGIHKDELGTEFGNLPSIESLESLFAKEGQTPSHVVPALSF